MASHPGILYFYSESIGLAANGTCAFVAALANFGFTPRGSLSTGIIFLAIGGVIQLLCSLRAFRSYDHFGATLLGFYSTFWAILGLEIILFSSIHFLHIALLVVGVLLLVVAPLVNAFHTILVLAIAAASSLELALRVVDESSVLNVITAVSELIVVLTTSYGCCAAVLHGIHERQVLPGLDDALIETVLWKRAALKSNYSDGKWANPSPLAGLCSAMGFAGMVMEVWSNIFSWKAKSLWFTTFAVILGVVSLFHALRHERIWAVSTICNTCLFTLMAVDNTYDSAKGEVFLSFAIICVYIFFFAVAERFPLVHMATFLLEAISLLAICIQVLVSDNGSGATVVSAILFAMTSIMATYSAIADLANAIAQKELFPTGQELGWAGLFTNKTKKEGKLIHRNTSVASNVQTECDEESGGPFTRIRFFSGLTRRRLGENMLKQFAINNNIDLEKEKEVEPRYPGDHKLVGKSDFISPLFVMFTGTVLYSLLMSIGMFASSEQAVLDAAFVLLVTFTSSLLMCACRGTTSFGFVSFIHSLEGTIILISHYSGDKTYQNLIVVLALKTIWLLSSYREFYFLTVTTLLQLLGFLFYAISNFVGGNENAFVVMAGVFFTLTSIISLVTLGLLLSSHKSLFCRLLLQNSSADTEELCEIGYASDRAQFDKCIRILKEGGVCCIPTDTVYCLACAANSPDAIKRIYEIKSRPSEKPLSLWLGSIDDIKSVAPEGKGWSPKLWSFMEAIWPGSVSLVVSRGAWLKRLGVGSSADLIGTADSIALRVPNSTLTVALLKETGPLAITSANPSGQCDCTHHNKVDDVIASKIDFILADGASPTTIASSVVDVRNVDNNELFFYRVGCVPEAYIWDKLTNTRSGAQPMLVDLHRMTDRNIGLIKSFMSHMINLAGCDAYKVYLLTLEENKDPSSVIKTPWKDLAPRVQTAFQSGTLYYDDKTTDTVKESQIVVPIRDKHGKIIAVLQLLNKVADTGQRIPFERGDLIYANLASPILSNNVSTKTVTNLTTDFDWELEVNAVTLNERGYERTASWNR